VEETQMNHLKAKFLASGLPEHMFGGVDRYLNHGIQPGDFLSAVISNDLKGACGSADFINRSLLFQWVSFFYNHTPSNCWGSTQRMYEWINGFEPYDTGAAQ